MTTQTAAPDPTQTGPDSPDLAGQETGQPETAPKPRALTAAEWVVLFSGAIPGAAGVILSWGGMYEAARKAFTQEWMGMLVPIAVDGLIAFGAAGWIAAVHAGRRGTAWRMTAHLFVLLSVLLNGYAADKPSQIPWHIGGPLAWSLMVEVIAHHVASRRSDEIGVPADRIPLRLWLSAPGESWRTAKRMARTGERRADVARVEADRCEVATIALRKAMPGNGHRADLDMLTRRLHAGTVSPLHVLDVLRAGGWIGPDRPAPSERIDPDTIVWRVLGSGLSGQARGIVAPAPQPARKPAAAPAAAPVDPAPVETPQPAAADVDPRRPAHKPTADDPEWIAYVAQLLAELDEKYGRKVGRPVVAEATGITTSNILTPLLKAAREQMETPPRLSVAR